VSPHREAARRLLEKTMGILLFKDTPEESPIALPYLSHPAELSLFLTLGYRQAG